MQWCWCCSCQGDGGKGKHPAHGESGIIRTLVKVWQKSFPYNGPSHVGLDSGPATSGPWHRPSDGSSSASPRRSCLHRSCAVDHLEVHEHGSMYVCRYRSMSSQQHHVLYVIISITTASVVATLLQDFGWISKSMSLRIVIVMPSDTSTEAADA